MHRNDLPGDSYHDRMALAAAFFHVPLRRRTDEKFVGPCPRCGKGDDRFVVWTKGNAWCSRCGFSAWYLEGNERDGEEDIRIDRERRQRLLRERMAQCRDWITYHAIPEVGIVWAGMHVSEPSVAHWGLGYCETCPMAHAYPSLTIPVFYQQQLRDIRHRLVGVSPEEQKAVGKYRSHIAGLVPFPFNLDAMVCCRDILIIEGELKAIRLGEAGFDGVIGIPGVSIIEDLLDASSALCAEQTVTIGLDPGADTEALRIADAFLDRGVRVHLADFPIKPDDGLLEYGADFIRAVLEQTRIYQ